MRGSETGRYLYQTGCSTASAVLLLLFFVAGIRAVAVTTRNILDHPHQVRDLKQYERDCGQTAPPHPLIGSLRASPCQYERDSIKFIRISSKGGEMIAARFSVLGASATQYNIRNWDGRVDTVPASGQYAIQIWHGKPTLIYGPVKPLLTDVNPRELNTQAENCAGLAISLAFLTFSSLMFYLTVFGRGGILAALTRRRLFS